MTQPIKRIELEEFAKALFFTASHLIAYTVKKTLYFVSLDDFRVTRVVGDKNWLVCSTYGEQALIGTNNGEYLTISPDSKQSRIAQLAEPIWIGAVAEGVNGEFYSFAGLHTSKFDAAGKVPWKQEANVTVRNMLFEPSQRALWCVGDGIEVFDDAGQGKPVLLEGRDWEFSSAATSNDGLIACCSLGIELYNSSRELLANAPGPFVHIAFAGREKIFATEARANVGNQQLELPNSEIQIVALPQTSAVAYTPKFNFLAVVTNEFIELYRV